MDEIFNVADRNLTLEGPERPFGANFRLVVTGFSGRLRFRGLKIGITVTADGVTILDADAPRAGQSFAATDQAVIAQVQANWLPGQEIVGTSWVEENGERFEVMKTFTAPRPAQPFPSWTWGGTSWQPPVAYPDDGQDYVWIEASQAWELVS